MRIKTARINYKPNSDEVVVDITVKNRPLHILSPDWEIVNAFRDGKITWPEYEKRYYLLVGERYFYRPAEFEDIVKLAKQQTVVLTCFCTDEKHCHRQLAKHFLQTIDAINTIFYLKS